MVVPLNLVLSVSKMNICNMYLRSLRKLLYVRIYTVSIAQSHYSTNENKGRNKVVGKSTHPKRSLFDGPSLKDFLKAEQINNVKHIDNNDPIPYLQSRNYVKGRKVFFDVYGCQMNVNDTEIVWSILKSNGYVKVTNMYHADIVLLITCAIRDGAEQKIWNKLDTIKGLQKKRKNGFMKIGLLGCMAERLKHKVLEIDKSVDLIAGPDSYKDLPRLLALTEDNQTAINVMLSMDETYADVIPVRLDENSISAYVSVMRGCDNMCTYCIVPFTRGRERSRPVVSIIDEIKYLRDEGIKEVTLLGQNVNSFQDLSQGVNKGVQTNLVKGFKTVYKAKESGLRFGDLLQHVANIDPEIRIRFTSPHPKDFPDEVLNVIRLQPNICKSLHLPAQSGNTAVLERMRRGYSRDAYIELVEHIRNIIPNVALSSDFIAGFCGETDEEFEDTISLIRLVKYNNAYLFPYSMREKTTAHRRFVDNVADNVKATRHLEMTRAFRSEVSILNQQQVGSSHLILVEGPSKRSEQYLMGRNDQNVKVIIPVGELGDEYGASFAQIQPGDYIAVQINAATSQVLKGIPLYRTTLVNYFNKHPYKTYYDSMKLAGVV